MKRKFKPARDIPALALFAIVIAVVLYLAWNSGPVAVIWPAAT